MVKRKSIVREEQIFYATLEQHLSIKRNPVCLLCYTSASSSPSAVFIILFSLGRFVTVIPMLPGGERPSRVMLLPV